MSPTLSLYPQSNCFILIETLSLWVCEGIKSQHAHFFFFFRERIKISFFLQSDLNSFILSKKLAFDVNYCRSEFVCTGYDSLYGLFLGWLSFFIRCTRLHSKLHKEHQAVDSGPTCFPGQCAAQQDPQAGPGSASSSSTGPWNILHALRMAE